MERPSLYDCRNCIVYYGKNDAVKINGCDIVIVEPLALKQEDIRMLKDQNSYVFGYLSMMEADLSSGGTDFLDNGGYLRNSSGIIVNEKYNTVLADLQSQTWQQKLMVQVKELHEKGFDGLFLDTLGDILYFDIEPRQKNRLILSAVDVLSGMKENHPDLLLIQNNAIEISNYTLDCIDALCWEYPALKCGQTAWTRSIFKYLNMIRKNKKIPVIVLCDNMKSRAVKRKCKRYGFIFYNAPKDYLSLDFSE